MSIDQQIEEILDEQGGMLNYLRENYTSLEPKYRQCLISAIDLLEEQWIKLVQQQYNERRKEWATE